ncbi:MAG: DDE-type integrase/transposase/recombinase [Desulfobulbaceae bacterium]|nr:DDE-type integrase/transposase/recombinase [Desulfobulbaceae bacterium]
MSTQNGQDQSVCEVLQVAFWRRNMPTGVSLHSDRGSQYCSSAYQSLMAKHQPICSMSGKGNCYDNACVESFFHSLEVEPSAVRVLPLVKRCTRPCSNMLKLTAIVIADIVPLAIPAPWCLRRFNMLN